MLPEFPFRYDFDQAICIPARDVRNGRNTQHANCGFTVASANYDFVVQFHRVRRLCRTVVEQNKTRIAKLLSNCSTRAEAAEF